MNSINRCAQGTLGASGYPETRIKGARLLSRFTYGAEPADLSWRAIPLFKTVSTSSVPASEAVASTCFIDLRRLTALVSLNAPMMRC